MDFVRMLNDVKEKKKKKKSYQKKLELRKAIIVKFDELY